MVRDYYWNTTVVQCITDTRCVDLKSFDMKAEFASEKLFGVGCVEVARVD